MKLLRSLSFMLPILALLFSITPTPIVRAELGILNPKLSGDQNVNSIILVSPDGSRVVYTVNVGGATPTSLNPNLPSFGMEAAAYEAAFLAG